MSFFNFRVLFFSMLLALSLLFMAKARPLGLPEPTTSNLLARLKLGEESTNCWDSLIQLQSCTGELIMFFMNGETDIGHGCCQAISTISHQCWPTMIDALGFTTEESHVLEGYCDHEEDDQSPRSLPLTNENKEFVEDTNDMMDNLYREAGSTVLEEAESSMVFVDLHGQDEDHIRKIKEFQAYFDKVKKMVKPGCSQEVLKVALNSMSSLVSILTYMSSPKLHSSL